MVETVSSKYIQKLQKVGVLKKFYVIIPVTIIEDFLQTTDQYFPNLLETIKFPHFFNKNWNQSILELLAMPWQTNKSN